MQDRQSGVTFIEIGMALVSLAIVAVVAFPVLPSFKSLSRESSLADPGLAVDKVRAAYDRVLVSAGRYPMVNELVEYVDEDFTSASQDMTGVVFWGYKKRIKISTYSDKNCSRLTDASQPGVTDIVRCVGQAAES